VLLEAKGHNLKDISNVLQKRHTRKAS